MFVVIWEFVVKAGREKEFEAIYGPHGDWVSLFRLADGYLGTELLADTSHGRCYLTIDRWQSEEQYNEFLQKYRDQYKTLDDKCKDLTEHEAMLCSARSL